MAAKLSGCLRAAAEKGDAASLEEHISKAQQADGQLQKAVNMQDPENDMTALMLAAAGGHADCCSLLLSARALTNIVAEDAGNRTALHLAAYDGYVEVVKLLLDANVDLRMKSVDGETACDVARQRAKEWMIGGGDGEERIECLNQITTLLEAR